jgi:hypothetical protein
MPNGKILSSTAIYFHIRETYTTLFLRQFAHRRTSFPINNCFKEASAVRLIFVILNHCYNLTAFRPDSCHYSHFT